MGDSGIKGVDGTDSTAMQAREENSFSPGVINQSLQIFENKERQVNENKLRIRNMPSFPSRNSKLLVLELLNSMYMLGLQVFPSQVVDAKRVDCWDGIETPRDIVVTFDSEASRNAVYSKRHFIEKWTCHAIKVLDELDTEGALIYGKAVKFFGDARVDTSQGFVRVHTCDGNELVHSMQQLEAVMNSETEAMWHFVFSPESLELEASKWSRPVAKVLGNPNLKKRSKFLSNREDVLQTEGVERNVFDDKWTKTVGRISQNIVGIQAFIFQKQAEIEELLFSNESESATEPEVPEPEAVTEVPEPEAVTELPEPEAVTELPPLKAETVTEFFLAIESKSLWKIWKDRTGLEIQEVESLSKKFYYSTGVIW